MDKIDMKTKILQEKDKKKKNSLLLIGRIHATFASIRPRLLLLRPLVKHQARMSKAKRNRSQHYRNAFKRNERGLLPDQLAIVSVLELSNTVRASRKDNENRRRQAAEKHLEAPAKDLCSAGAQVSNHVVGKGGDKGSQDNDLQGETGQGDVDARVLGVVGFGRQGTAGGLQDEADDVKGDEDPVEELRLEAGEVGCKVDDCLGEGDIDGGCEEDWCDGDADLEKLLEVRCYFMRVDFFFFLEKNQLTDLDHEALKGKRVIV